MEPKISVVMLNFNGLQYLKKTVPAVLNFNYSNYEFIIIDNGSTDDSVLYLESFKEKITLIKNKTNLGYSGGKNLGAKVATGDFLFLLDNDIFVSDTDILKNLVKKLTKIGEKNILSLVMVNDGEQKTKYYSYCYGFFGPIYNKDLEISKIKPLTYRTGAPMGGNVFVSKKTWDAIGGFDETQPYYLDDFDIGARGSILGYESFITSDYYLNHLGVAEVISQEKWLWKYKYFFSGYSIVMFKDYNSLNLFIRYPLFFIFSAIKTIKYCFKFKNLKPASSYIWSFNYFLKNFNSTLKKRKVIQSLRLRKNDIFLTIKPPKF
jgi:GT2 family glycosyltransferase